VGDTLRLLPGYRRVHATVAPYAASWEEANALVMTALGAAPLWVALGDSTAQGIGAPTYDQGYVGQLRSLLAERTGTQWQVLNLSRSGARAADVLTTQLPRLAGLRQVAGVDLVTCAVGANDLLRTPLDTLVATVRAIVAGLPRGAVIATLPQGLAQAKAERVNEVIREEAPVAGLRVADVWRRTGAPFRGKFAADAFHPNARGYADWAAAFAEALPPPG
jgi:lysophospholipase L1-like esterase